MAKFMKYFSWLYALIFAVIIVLAVISIFGGFSHPFMDPGM
jgi:hypothetical protein